MKQGEVLLMLVFGFCFVYVFPAKPNGGCPFDNYEDMINKLKEISGRKQHLYELFARATDPNQRTDIEKDLNKMVALEENTKHACKMLQKDGDLTMTPEQKTMFLQQKDKRRAKLLIAMGLSGQIRNIIVNEKDRIMRGIYQERFELMNELKDKLEKDLEDFTEESFISDLKGEQLGTNEGDVAAAQDLHSQVLEAMAILLQEGIRPITVPHQDEIKKLRNKSVQIFVSSYNEEQFHQTKLQLEALQKKLYEERTNLTMITPLPTSEKEIAELKQNIIREREQEHHKIKEILAGLMSKRLVDYVEEEIAALRSANIEVAAMDKRLQEVALQSAYLQAESQVADLLKVCSDITLRRADELQDSHKQQESSVASSYASTDPNPDPREEVQEIATVIYEKGLNLKLLLDLFRNEVNTSIAEGLYRINKKIPLSLFGCDTSDLKHIQDTTKEWAANVKYALRLSKKMYEDKISTNRQLMGFLAAMWDYFFGKSNSKNQQDVGVDGVEETTTSIEEFERQRECDFEKHFKYIKENLSLLEVRPNNQLDEKILKEMRFNFIAVRELPGLLKYMSKAIPQEICGNSEDGSTANVLQSSKALLKVATTAEQSLRHLLDATKSQVKSSIEVQVQKFQSAVEENERCQAAIQKEVDKFSMFGF